MFFISIFGIEQRDKIIAERQNIICPICNAYGRYNVIKSYNYFHAFFIPLWRWNVRYYIQSYCCKKQCALDKDIGQKIDKGEPVEIYSENIRCGEHNGLNICPHCSSHVAPDFQYCPYCGNKI
jgi:RNA polymerase subunit RPABC4/transcription elongation factor Spt4